MWHSGGGSESTGCRLHPLSGPEPGNVFQQAVSKCLFNISFSTLPLWDSSSKCGFLSLTAAFAERGLGVKHCAALRGCPSLEKRPQRCVCVNDASPGRCPWEAVDHWRGERRWDCWGPWGTPAAWPAILLPACCCGGQLAVCHTLHGLLSSALWNPDPVCCFSLFSLLLYLGFFWLVAFYFTSRWPFIIIYSGHHWSSRNQRNTYPSYS